MQETPGRGEGSRGDVREADLGSSTFGVARLSPATFSYKDDADLINTPRPTPPKSVSTPQSPSGKKSSSATWYTVDVSFPHRPRTETKRHPAPAPPYYPANGAGPSKVVAGFLGAPSFSGRPGCRKRGTNRTVLYASPPSESFFAPDFVRSQKISDWPSMAASSLTSKAVTPATANSLKINPESKNIITRVRKRRAMRLASVHRHGRRSRSNNSHVNPMPASLLSPRRQPTATTGICAFKGAPTGAERVQAAHQWPLMSTPSSSRKYTDTQSWQFSLSRFIFPETPTDDGQWWLEEDRAVERIRDDNDRKKSGPAPEFPFNGRLEPEKHRQGKKQCQHDGAIYAKSSTTPHFNDNFLLSTPPASSADTVKVKPATETDSTLIPMGCRSNDSIGGGIESWAVREQGEEEIKPQTQLLQKRRVRSLIQPHIVGSTGEKQKQVVQAQQTTTINVYVRTRAKPWNGHTREQRVYIPGVTIDFRNGDTETGAESVSKVTPVNAIEDGDVKDSTDARGKLMPGESLETSKSGENTGVTGNDSFNQDNPKQYKSQKRANMGMANAGLVSARKRCNFQIPARRLLRNVRRLLQEEKFQRVILGWWVEASKDVLMALKGIEDGSDLGCDSSNEEEERAEEAALSGKKRWRAITYRAIVRHRAPVQGGFSAVASTIIAARRGLRARVMLVAAKILAHGGKPKSAISCTRDVRDLAARHSALQYGSSGVASAVTHEAFKLEIEWLQEIDEFEAAAATAQQMDEQAKRTANEKLMQDGLIATEAEKTGGDGRICATSLVPGAEDESIDLDKTYEAAVWAKVMHASLTIRKTELFKHGIMGTGSELLLIEGMSTHMNINTSTHIAGGGISSSWKASTAPARGQVQDDSYVSVFSPAAIAAVISRLYTKSSPRGKNTEHGTMQGDDILTKESPNQKVVSVRQVEGAGETGTMKSSRRGGPSNRYRTGNSGMQKGAGDTGGRNPKKAVKGVVKDSSSRGDSQVHKEGAFLMNEGANDGVGESSDFEIISGELSEDAGKRVDLLVEDRKGEPETEDGGVAAKEEGGGKVSEAKKAKGVNGVGRKMPFQTDYDTCKGLERAIAALSLVLEDGQMAWRASTCTPGILSSAVERLAGLAKEAEDEGDIAVGAELTPAAVCDNEGPTRSSQAFERLQSGTRGRSHKLEPVKSSSKEFSVEATRQQTKPLALSTKRRRQTILESGEQSFQRSFTALEFKLSELLSAWKPLWKVHSNSKHMRHRLGRAVNYLGMASRLGVSRTKENKRISISVRGSMLELLISLVESGVDIKAYAEASETPVAANIKTTATGGKLPKHLGTRLAQMLKILGVIVAVLEQRAHLATLAGNSAEYIISILEIAIRYLCLSRVDHPGLPIENLSQDKPGSVPRRRKPAHRKKHGVKNAKDSGKDASAIAPASDATLVASGGTASLPIREPHRSTEKLPRRTELLPWNVTSLSSLLILHRVMAAAYLRVQRAPGPNFEDEDVSNKGLHNFKLFVKAEESLTIALTLAGVGSASSNHFPSPTVSNEQDFVSARLPEKKSQLPATAEGGGRRHNGFSLTRPFNGKSASTIAQTEQMFTRRKKDAAVAIVVKVCPNKITELCGMRCTAREGLGKLEEALEDVQRALMIAPEAPKLWVKAALLALRVENEMEQDNNKRWADGKQVGQFPWATEAIRFASGLLKLCPRSLHGFLLRGQAAEKKRHYVRAMRDYCHAQHTHPWSILPALLRVRLAARLDREETQILVGRRVEGYAVEAAKGIGAFLWSPFLLVEACFRERAPAQSMSTRACGARIGEIPPMKRLLATRWKGRVKELEQSYGQASKYYELVYEKSPTLEHLNLLASCYLRMNLPGKADQVLSRFINDLAVASSGFDSAESIAEAPQPNAERGRITIDWSSAESSQAELSKMRILHGRALFAVGKDEKRMVSFNQASKGVLQKSSVLYEWALSLAIETCMHSVSKSDAGDNESGRQASDLPMVHLGTPAWNPALFKGHKKSGAAIRKAWKSAAVAARAIFHWSFLLNEHDVVWGKGGLTVEEGNKKSGSKAHEKSCTVNGANRASDKSISDEGGQEPDQDSQPAFSNNIVDQEQKEEDGNCCEEELSPGMRVENWCPPSKGGLDKAIELTSRCLLADGFNAKAYTLRAEMEARLGRKDRAITDFQAAALLETGDPRSRINQGVMYLHASRPGLASAVFGSIEGTSKGLPERILAAYNLGVSAATTGDLRTAESAFTRALVQFPKISPRDKEKISIAPATCRDNRGLVRFAMKNYTGAVEDLGRGRGDSGNIPKTRQPTAVGDRDVGTIKNADEILDKRKNFENMGQRAPDVLDCLLGRALALGRLENKASRQAAWLCLWKLLRFNKLLASEVAAVRVGLGNIAATSGEIIADRWSTVVHTQTAACDGTKEMEDPTLFLPRRPVRKYFRRSGRSRALREFLHAIHSCPTASTAWLNASEVLETTLERDQSTINFNGSVDPAQALSSVPGRVASLALLDAILAMTPRHYNALRCHATTLAGLGQMSRALAQAHQVVYIGEEAMLATESKEPPSDKSAVAMNDNVQLSPQMGGVRNDSSGLTSVTETETSTALPHNGRKSTIKLYEECSGEEQPFLPIGFMPSSKVTVTMGGLLQGGGGRPDALDFAKGLVLRGCLRQKMDRARHAEEDYRRALEICRGQMKRLSRHANLDYNSIDSSQGEEPHEDGKNSLDGARAGTKIDDGDEKTQGRRKNPGNRGGQRVCFEETKTTSTPGSMGQVKYTLPKLPDNQLSAGGKDKYWKGKPPGFRKRHWLHYCAILKLESLIHYNLASLHLASVLKVDICSPFHKAAAAREAFEFVACEGKAATCSRRSQHQSWWHSTFLAVVQMASTVDSLVGGPWREKAINDAGGIARLELGAAAIAAAMPSGYEENQALPGAWSLEGAARSRALVAIDVNLAAAEKLGAMSASRRVEQRRAGLARAVDCISDAIGKNAFLPELYIERGGLLARIGEAQSGGDSGGEGEAAASDFATALWLGGHGRRGHQTGVDGEKASRPIDLDAES